MKTQFGHGRVGPTGRLEAELPAWLRGFDAGPMPVAARLRISADLRAETSRSRHILPHLPQILSAAAALLILLVGAGLFLIVVKTTGTTIGGAGTPSVLPTGVIEPYSSPGSSPQLANPLWLAFVLCVSALAGVATRSRPVRTAVGRLVLGADGAIPAPVARLPRRLREVPRLALLATLPIVEVAWSRSVYGPTVLAYSISVALPATLACAIALRYPIGDRSARWLLVGGIALAVAKLPELGLGTAADRKSVV